MIVNEGDKTNALLYLARKVWKYSSGNRKNIVIFVTMFVIARCILLFFEPLIWAKMLDVIQKQGITTTSLNTLVALLLMTLGNDFVFWCFHGPARCLEIANAFLARINYRRYLLKGIMNLPLDWHTDHHSGDTNDKIEKGTGALFRFSEDSFVTINAIVDFLGSFAILVYLSPSSALIVSVIMAITVWIVMRFDERLIVQYKELNRAENRISERTLDSITNITTVIILRIEGYIFKSIVHEMEKPYGLFKKSIKLNELKWFITNMGCTLMTALVLGVYFYKHAGNYSAVSVAVVYLIIHYLRKVSEIFFRFAEIYGNIVQNKTKVMNAEKLAKDFKSEDFTNHVLPQDWKTLSIKDLHFSYHSEGTRDLHLQNVAMNVRRGERIALVGDSGDGKTTLLKVIRDLYHPIKLDLAVDGKQIPHGFKGIARAISLVPQNPEIFATTILENITMGAEHDITFVRRFTDMACFTDVVEKLPKRFDSSIREKGVNLSGGQQQRLALSRGLLACHDKDIVLLDEPTSSIDTKTEMRIYQNIFREFKGKVIMSSIHRLHLLALFDRIYVFDKGRIIDSGTLQELLVSCPKLSEAWKQYMETAGM